MDVGRPADLPRGINYQPPNLDPYAVFIRSEFSGTSTLHDRNFFESLHLIVTKKLGIMAPLTQLLPFLSLFQRAPKYKPYITITTEPQAPCRHHADNMPYSVHSFGANNKLNVSCWTTSTMKDNKGRLNDNEGSWLYLWVNTNGSFGPPELFSYPGVGNVDQGGKAGGEGCWLHEDAAKEGADIDFTETLQWCGAAPQHQVRHSPFREVCESIINSGN